MLKSWTIGLKWLECEHICCFYWIIKRVRQKACHRYRWRQRGGGGIALRSNTPKIEPVGVMCNRLFRCRVVVGRLSFAPIFVRRGRKALSRPLHSDHTDRFVFPFCAFCARRRLVSSTEQKTLPVYWSTFCLFPPPFLPYDIISLWRRVLIASFERFIYSSRYVWIVGLAALHSIRTAVMVRSRKFRRQFA